jgi:hypothetical protein
MCGGKAESGVMPDGPSQFITPLGEPVSGQSGLTNGLTMFWDSGGKAEE